MTTPTRSLANQMVSLTANFEEWLQVLMLTPVGEPSDLDCIWGIPVMLHGEPGIGKSARIRQVARSLNLPYEVVELSGRQPEDAGGAPFLKRNKATGEDEIYVECTLPAINRLNNKGHGVLFLDELPNARPATQGAFLAMVEERRVGDTLLSPNIRIIAAGNPPGSSAGSFSLSPPMANRFAHRDMGPPTAEEFARYLMTNGKLGPKDIHMMGSNIKESWDNVWPAVRGQIVGFTSVSDEHIFKMPLTGDVARGKAFTTPRSIERAGRAVATAMIMKKDADFQEDLFTALVGKGTGEAWSEWTSKANLPNPEFVISKGWHVDKDRLDIVSAILAGLVGYTLQQKDAANKIRCAVGTWKYIDQVVAASLADLAFQAAKPLVRAELSTGNEAVANASRASMLLFSKKGFNMFADN